MHATMTTRLENNILISERRICNDCTTLQIRRQWGANATKGRLYLTSGAGCDTKPTPGWVPYTTPPALKIFLGHYAYENHPYLEFWKVCGTAGPRRTSYYENLCATGTRTHGWEIETLLKNTIDMHSDAWISPYRKSRDPVIHHTCEDDTARGDL